MRWPFATAKPTQAVSDANARPATRFAFKLFGQLAAAAATQNIVLSPASVMLCLGMFQEGATGETREAIAETLEIAELGPGGCTLFEIGTASSRTRHGISSLPTHFGATSSSRDGLNRPPNLREYFEVEINALDFRDPGSVERINEWVSEKTREKIGRILATLIHYCRCLR